MPRDDDDAAKRRMAINIMVGAVTGKQPSFGKQPLQNPLGNGFDDGHGRDLYAPI